MQALFISQRKKMRLGFTLTESAIVLGVIGLIAAAIWAASISVKSRQQFQDGVEIVTEIADRVRGVYTGFPNATVPTDVAAQITANLYPEAILNRNRDNTISPWGGTIYIRFPGAAPRYGFSVEVNIPVALDKIARRDACLGMITRLSGTATSYTSGTAGTLPSNTVPLEPAQGNSPALAFVNAGGWTNVTRSSLDEIMGLFDASECTGVAYYFLM